MERGFRIWPGLPYGQNQALTVLCVPYSLEWAHNLYGAEGIDGIQRDLEALVLSAERGC